MRKAATYLFRVTGGFEVDERLTPLHSACGSVIGFRLLDGRTVDLGVCLRVETKSGDSEKWVTSERSMAQLGLQLGDYDECEFVVSEPPEEV